MTYIQAIKYLESFVNYEQLKHYSYKNSFGLERINNFLRSIHNPEQNLKIIHVAGSKGKGSTCAFIAYILRTAGFKVGLYTSPHLSDFRERIRVLLPIRYPLSAIRYEFEGMISKKSLAGLVKKLKPAIDAYNKESKSGPLTFFEVWTVLAWVYFKEKKVDFVVLETGLGGRLDATNATNALVSVITPISYEHTQYLGKTLRKIAEEKAGIIKSHKSQVTSHKLVVISSPQKLEAGNVIRRRCKEVCAKLYEIGQQVKVRDFKIRLLGKHQLINANVAAAAVKALEAYGIKINDGVIRKGLYNTLWPGRGEIFSRSPLIVLDGAHNLASVKALSEVIRNNFRYDKLILIFGACTDKDVRGMLKQLSKIADKIIFTSAQHARSMRPIGLLNYLDQLVRHCEEPPQGVTKQSCNIKIASQKPLAMTPISWLQKKKDIYITNNIQDAKRLALGLAKKSDLILVTGSLFVVGAFKNVGR